MEVRPGYKLKEVGAIPEDWDVKAVGDLVSLYQPETIPAKQFTESGFPVYGANGTVGYYHSFNHESWQVTVTCRGSTCGTVNKTVDRCWITGNAMVLNCDSSSEIDKSFLYFVMLGQDLSGCVTGTGQPQIVRSPLAAFRVAMPRDLAEQRAIATALSDVDALLEGLTRLIAKKRDLKQAAMQQLLSGRTRLPRFTGEWEDFEFGDVAKIRNTKVIASTMPVGTRCVELDSIAAATGRLVGSLEASGSSVKYSFKEGDVLFGRLRAYLRKYWKATFDGICSTEIWPLTPRDSRVIGGFLHLLVQTAGFIDAASISYGTHMPRTDWSVVRRLRVPIPSKAEQAAIVAVLSDMDAEIAVLERRYDKTRGLRQAMMQELLTGRTRLVGPRHEGAAAC